MQKKTKKRRVLLRSDGTKQKFEKRLPPSEIERRRFERSIKRPSGNFAKDVTIDRSKLDLENASYPAIFEYWAKVYAKALEAKETAEATFSGEKARMAEHVRDNPATYGLEKVTEGAVTQALPLHSHWKNCQAKYLEALTHYKLMEQRMRILTRTEGSLSNLTTLYSKGYFTSTSMSMIDMKDMGDGDD